MITVDLMSRTMKKNRKVLIQDGKPVNGYAIRESPVTFDLLEHLYARYKTSVPAGDWDQSRYFRALPSSALSFEQLARNPRRKDACAELESAVLEGALNGSLIWPDKSMWYWQSEKEPGLVLLRDWIIPRDNEQA